MEGHVACMATTINSCKYDIRKLEGQGPNEINKLLQCKGLQNCPVSLYLFCVSLTISIAAKNRGDGWFQTLNILQYI